MRPLDIGMDLVTEAAVELLCLLFNPCSKEHSPKCAVETLLLLPTYASI